MELITLLVVTKINGRLITKLLVIHIPVPIYNEVATLVTGQLAAVRQGRAAKENLLLAEASEAVSPYGVVGHRHTSEIEQIAGQAAGQAIQLQFTPHLMPMVRGLLATVYARLRDPGLTADDCTTLLKAAYRHSTSVAVLPVGTYPSTKWVRQTNRCLLSVQVDRRTGQLIVMSAIDNLIKGQAGQGVQCLNLLAGLEAHTGLPQLPFYP